MHARTALVTLKVYSWKSVEKSCTLAIDDFFLQRDSQHDRWMHLTKNLCVNLLGFICVYGRPKDTIEAWQDLRCLKEWENLHLEKTDDGCHYLSPASYTYTLSKEEKDNLFECLDSTKVPSGFSSNIIKGYNKCGREEIWTLRVMTATCSWRNWF